MNDLQVEIYDRLMLGHTHEFISEKLNIPIEWIVYVEDAFQNFY